MSIAVEEIPKIVEEMVKPFENKEGNLIMILHRIQNRFSYVPREISFEVAKRLRIPLARIYEVITFYHYFKLEPPGKHVISVCMGTACYLKGAPILIEELKRQLGVNPGETTPDKRLHLQIVRCLGCCGLAPVLTVGGKVYGRLVPEKISEILAEYSSDDVTPEN